MPAIARSRTPTPDELQLEAKVNELARAVAQVWDARHTKERFDRIEHGVDRLHERLDGYAERVVRAEEKGEGAWEAVKDLGPQLTSIQREISSTTRLADGVEQLIERMDGHSSRLGAIEKAQESAAIRFEEHDKRDQQIAASVSSIDRRVGALETAKAVADETGKVRKLVARQRSWWLSAKGVSTVVGAVAAATAVVIAAVYAGGCT